MGQQLTKLTFEQWVDFVFNHPVTEPAWYWDGERDWWNGSSATVVAYLTQLFANAGEALASFSDAQASQGLWYLASADCSGRMFALVDEEVPWLDRQACIRSMYDLFEKYFAVRCTPHLSHLDHADVGTPDHVSPLNGICFIWWDLIPIHGNRKLLDLDEEILQVIEAILYLPSVACQESALLGFGEWSPYYRSRISAMIKRFLKGKHELTPGIRKFALEQYDRFGL